MGNRNHSAEPVPVLRRAPTLTDEQRQQRVGSRALSPSELWSQSSKERPREASRIDILRSIQLSPGKPDTIFLRSNHGKTSKRCIWLHVVPIRMSPWMTDDDPLTKLDNAAALSTNEATENSGTGPGSSRVRSKDPPLRSQIYQPSKLVKSPFNDIEGYPWFPPQVTSQIT